MTTSIPAPHDLDPFFAIPEDRTWNACIGPQGDEENYVDGYVEAALELASAVLERQLFASRDTLVLPILYNARHGIELSLKFALKCLFAAEVVKEGPAQNHKIGEHFEALEKAKIGDAEIRDLLARLRPYVTSLATIDEDGQQLRYAEDLEGKQSLQDKPLANIEVIRDSLVKLKATLGQLKYRVMDFCEERGTGSFTPTCSRKDLLQIARLLPPRREWGGDAFTTAKAEVMARYVLSGNKFSDAVNVITKNREMGALLGIDFPLAHLTDQHAHLVFALWTKQHPPRTNSDESEWPDLVSGERLLALLHEDRADRSEIAKSLLAVISQDELADLEVVYYLGRDGGFPERYEQLLASTKRQHAVENRPQHTAQHILSKTNLLTCFARGARRLGRPRLADSLLALRPDNRDA